MIMYSRGASGDSDAAGIPHAECQRVVLATIATPFGTATASVTYRTVGFDHVFGAAASPRGGRARHIRSSGRSSFGLRTREFVQIAVDGARAGNSGVGEAASALCASGGGGLGAHVIAGYVGEDGEGSGSGSA